MNLLFVLPKNLLSRWVGHLMNVERPKALARWMVKSFAQIYRIDLAAAELPLESYSSIGKFFTRKLKDGLRPQGVGVVTHPADSLISQFGVINQGQLIQAKGRTYPVEIFLQNPEAQEIYNHGFFATYYLCPTDYHRVHSPVKGEIVSVTLVPGNLWPVNEWSVGRIDQLFCVNERVVIEMRTATGMISVVLVGATNVGKISVSFEPKILSNQFHQPLRISYSTPISVNKGDELGVFHMGSTVILVGDQGFMAGSKTMAQVDFQAMASQFVGRAVRVGGVLFE